MMQRRGFLGAILAAGVAPAFVGSSVLMPVRKVLAAEPAQIIAPASTIFAPSGGIIPGDVFTIAGIAGSFRVTCVSKGGTIGLTPYAPPSRLERTLARLGLA
jgi:hypothetical protein